MPAKDRYHDVVKRALVKAGWVITRENVGLMIGARRLFIDLMAKPPNAQRLTLIEIKGFDVESKMDALAESAGQCLLYQLAIEHLEIDATLYLAIPRWIAGSLFTEILGQLVLSRLKLKLLVFDPVAEEVVQWTA
jgi:uncharacterized Fe-S cluster-containing radical SAM superfamily protein